MSFMTTFQSHLVDIGAYKIFFGDIHFTIRVASVPNTFMLDRAFLEWVYFTFENNGLNENKNTYKF